MCIKAERTAETSNDRFANSTLDTSRYAHCRRPAAG